MVPFLICVLFCLVVIISGIYSIHEGIGIFCVFFGTILLAIVIFCICNESSPIESATDKVVSSEEIKLATILEDENECYVLRDSRSNYYFITEIDNQFGAGHSLYEEKWISGNEAIVVEDEISVYPYVEIIQLDAKPSAGTLGIQPVYKYVFHVPEGTICFTEEMPIEK